MLFSVGLRSVLAAFLLLPAALVGGTVCSPALTSVDMVTSRQYEMAGKVVVITGGDSGIGYGAAMGVAAAGAQVVMLGHSEGKTSAAAANITLATGNPNITVIAPFDLTSFASVRQVAFQLLQKLDRLDVIVCDAGQNYEVVGHELTTDGFEATFQVTFLGHFLLVESLLPLLRHSRGRVVHAGCDSNGFVNTTTGIVAPLTDTVCTRSDSPSNCTEPEQLQQMLRAPLPTHKSTFAFLAHFMKTFYARELTARSTEAESAAGRVNAFVAHPGIVSTPGLPADDVNFTEFCSFPNAWYACNCWSKPDRSFDLSVCPLSPLRGGNTLAFLATAPASELEPDLGRMFAACEAQTAPLDQFGSMVEAKGEAATLHYAQTLTALWRTFVGL